MQRSAREICLDEAFQRIEESILPSLSMMIDTLLDAAALARPGFDAEGYAAELRTIGFELENLIQQVESCSPAIVDPGDYRVARSSTAA